MDWLREVLRPLAARWYWRYLVCGKQVLEFAAMRRSGHHAMIYWFINSWLGREIVKERRGHHLLIGSSDRRVFYVNDYGEEDARLLFRAIRKQREAIREAELIVASREDVRRGASHFLWSRRPEIYVSRSILNICASRIKDQQRVIELGLPARAIKPTDDKWFEVVQTWTGYAGPTWNYEQWLINEDYRQAILAQFNIDHEILPALTTEGQGSSFDESLEDVRSRARRRYEQVDFPEELLQRLLRYDLQLSAEEREFVERHLGGPAY